MKIPIKERLLFTLRIEENNSKDKLTSIITKSLLDKLAITTYEIDKYNIRDDNNFIEWDATNGYDYDKEFAKCELKMLYNIVKQMELKDEIDFSNVDICSEIEDAYLN